MQYALLINAEPGHEEALSDAERDAGNAEYVALADAIRYLWAAHVQPAETATRVRPVVRR